MAVSAAKGRGPVRCGFLFNHDQLHQLAHSAPIAFEMLRRQDGPEVRLFVTSQAQQEALQRVAEKCGLQTGDIVRLRLPLLLRLLQPLLDPLMPFSRVLMLLCNRAAFRDLDVLVVPEKTSLLLRSRFGLKHLKFVHTRHGAGDREVGFDKASGEFDLVLMSGQKIRDRLTGAGLLKDGGHAVIGYPKFDLHAAAGESVTRPKLFDNDRPTVLYNPHCSPCLSSWYGDGLAVLEAFYRSDRYNLIVAPHVMLFAKRLQLSLDRWRFDAPGEIPARYRDCPHMLIDTGSTRSCDMTYTEAADLYLGDASSQVYEFLHRPRPCVFLNTQGVAWQDDDNFRHWNAGAVLDDVEHLEDAIDEAFASHSCYIDTQRALFDYSFDLRETPSSVRGADAIRAFCARQFPAAAVSGQTAGSRLSHS
ncbi:hypothetical protein [uncultured Nevskia sp.]|uniref:hypothetical protein n=1 Tax=uncultured Nevskia sp. TaxID=228950 RepID=UPI0025F0176C|nr:hypothetical protein [uncultured Nevskia sp.]